MFESFSENSIYWLLGTALVMLLITVVGYLTSMNLPSKDRKMRVRKSALIGIAVFFFCVPLFKPSVYSSSIFLYEDEIKAENLDTIEDVVQLDKKQTRTIERLKEEVIELKRDTRRMNLYYSSIIQFLSTIIAVGALSYVFRKKEDSGE